MRTTVVACLLVLAQGVSAQGPADAVESPSGEYLYIARGCLGCHGASGEGGVGPTLARTGLPFDAFLDQVRAPRGIMPAFPAEAVTEAELRTIYGYVRELASPPAPSVIKT